MSALIRCEHVDFGYENHDAVIDVSMEINPGDCASWEKTVRERVR